MNSPRTAKRLGPIPLAAVALAATWTAGFVDTVGFLLLSHILTANMSGNTVRIGVSAIDSNGAEALRRGWPVLMFVAGLVTSAIIHEAGARRRFLSTSAVIFALETLLLLAVDVFYLIRGVGQLAQGSSYLAAAALLAFAMGLQNATLTHVGALSVKTTHITGTLTQFAEGVSQFYFWARDRLSFQGNSRWRRTVLLAPHQKSFRQALLMLLLWSAFIFGAICAAAARRHFSELLLLPPAVMAFALAVIDVLHPLAASDEHQLPSRAA